MNAAAKLFSILFLAISTMALAQESSQATVQVMQSDEYGAYLADGEGRTLYLFVDEQREQDGPLRMTEGVRDAAAPCPTECLDAWPPYTTDGDVSAAEGVDPELLYVTKIDDRQQVVYNGWPLYHFVRDQQPGDTNGQEIHSFGGEWYLVTPEGHEVEEHEESADEAGFEPLPVLTIAQAEGQGLEPYLADNDGKSLYLFTADSQGGNTSTCYEACANAWPPYLVDSVPEAAGGVDASLIGTLVRDDGATQVTYNGWPLYYYRQDENPGDVEGQDIHGFGGEWYLLAASGEQVGHAESGKEEHQEPSGAMEIPEGPTVTLQLVADGFTHPVMLAEAPDDTGRLFVADQTGQIWIVNREGEKLDEPFLDIAERMVDLKAHYDERGLLGLAFHPEYADNGRFFVYYSAPLREGAPDDFDHTSHLSEFRVTGDDPNVADAGSERVLLRVDEPHSNHNAGTLAFGPQDGYLYVSLGDGGNADDEGTGHVEDWYGDNDGGNGQDVTQNLLGSILRIDVDSGDPYGVPGDNAFIDTDALPEQFAYGFRNPYRFSFDIGGDHALYVGDAGQTLWEEISIVTPGGNYGWNVKEGTHCFDSEDPDDPPETCPDAVGEGHPRSGDALLDPIIEFRNASAEGGGLGLVVIGGHVYRGKAIPELQGMYLFGTWSRGHGEKEGEGHKGGAVFAAATDQGEGLWGFSRLRFANNENHELQPYLLSLAQDRSGEMYLLTTNEEGPTGETGQVFRLAPANP